MLCCGSDFPVENYKSYKNRNFEKHIWKIKTQLEQIKGSSLKGDDKIVLRKKLIELIQESK